MSDYPPEEMVVRIAIYTALGKLLIWIGFGEFSSGGARTARPDLIAHLIVRCGGGRGVISRRIRRDVRCDIFRFTIAFLRTVVAWAIYF
jgi:hypothetical protein